MEMTFYIFLVLLPFRLGSVTKLNRILFDASVGAESRTARNVEYILAFITSRHLSSVHYLKWITSHVAANLLVLAITYFLDMALQVNKRPLYYHIGCIHPTLPMNMLHHRKLIGWAGHLSILSFH